MEEMWVTDESEDPKKYKFSERYTVGFLLDLLVFERGSATAAPGLTVLHNDSEASLTTLLKELSPPEVLVKASTPTIARPQSRPSSPPPSPPPEITSDSSGAAPGVFLSPPCTPRPTTHWTKSSKESGSESPPSPPPSPGAAGVRSKWSGHRNSEPPPSRALTITRPFGSCGFGTNTLHGLAPQFSETTFLEGFTAEMTVEKIRVAVADRLRPVVESQLDGRLRRFDDLEEELKKASWVQLLFGGRLLRDALVLQNLEIGNQRVVAHVKWEMLLPDEQRVREREQIAEYSDLSVDDQ
jgi:hypothetical protein